MCNALYLFLDRLDLAHCDLTLNLLFLDQGFEADFIRNLVRKDKHWELLVQVFTNQNQILTVELQK